MKITDYTGLKPEVAKESADLLNNYLADLHVYYSNLRGFHWTIVGEHFYGMHAKLEEFYNEAFEQIDEVAERILMLESIPVRLYEDITKLAQIKQSQNLTEPKEIVLSVLESIKILIGHERKIIELAGANGDDVTVDLATGNLTSREKTAWMLASTLK